MPTHSIRLITICVLLLVLGGLSLGAAQNSNQAPPRADRPMTAEERLRREVDNLLSELQQLRAELAQARLEAESAQRELEEMRQFIRDHDVYGDAFEQYKAIREIAEREDRRREVEAARARREAERQSRAERLRQAREQRDQVRAEAEAERRLRAAGFTSIGMDVYISRTAYHYATRDEARTRIRFDPFIGFYSHVDRREQVDFSEMTISGSVLNASGEVRNMGVAIVFYDEHNNQAGQETIHITNARPDVPYPFTSTVKLALNREFASSTSYVLYADPAPPAPVEE
jgi:hypothetical protein